MEKVVCPNCCLPKVSHAHLKPRRGLGSALLLSATGALTLGAAWAVLGYMWARGQFRERDGYECLTCGHEWG